MLSPKPTTPAKHQLPWSERVRVQFRKWRELAHFWARTFTRRRKWLVVGLAYYVAVHLLLGVAGPLLLIPIVVGVTAYGMVWSSARAKAVENDGREPETARQIWRAWWLERRRVDWCRWRWERACGGLGLYRGGTSGIRRVNNVKRVLIPPVLRVRADLNADCRVTIDAGSVQVATSQIIAAKEKLEESFRAPEVIPHETGTRGIIELGIYWTDPLARITRLEDLPLSGDRTMLSYGTRRDGKPLLAPKGLSWLIGAFTGMGKSNTIWTGLASLLADGEYVDVYVSDTKRTELTQFAGSDGQRHGGVNGHGGLRVVKYVNTADATEKELLPAVAKRIVGRQDWMARQNPPVRKIVKSTAQNPLIVVLIDEITHIPDELAKGTKGNLGFVCSAGRAAFAAAWMCTQDARVETIKASLRTLIPTRTALGTDTPESTAAILGKDAENRGARASEIQKPGLCYAGSEDSRYFLQGRVPMVTDKETALIARGTVPPGMLHRSPADAPRPCYVYRVWEYERADGSRRRGYIGEAWDVEKRTVQHRDSNRKENLAWCPEHRRVENWWLEHIDEATMVVSPAYPSKRAALTAEEAAIKAEKPYWNRKHNWENRFAAHNAKPPKGDDLARVVAREPQLPIYKPAKVKPAKPVAAAKPPKPAKPVKVAAAPRPRKAPAVKYKRDHGLINTVWGDE
jgi:hypothetical protein